MVDEVAMVIRHFYKENVQFSDFQWFSYILQHVLFLSFLSSAHLDSAFIISLLSFQLFVLCSLISHAFTVVKLANFVTPLSPFFYSLETAVFFFLIIIIFMAIFIEAQYSLLLLLFYRRTGNKYFLHFCLLFTWERNPSFSVTMVHFVQMCYYL